MSTAPDSGPAAESLAAVVAEAVAVGLWLVDAAGRTLYRNAAFSTRAGELDRLDDLGACLPGVPLAAYAERVRGGAAAVEEPAVLLRRPGRSGRLMELCIEAGPLAGSVLITVRDVTDRARVERLGALVETAMALGHEIANPLAILRGEIELLTAEAPPGSRARLLSMIRSADRIDDVLRRLRRLGEPTSTDYLRSRGVRMVNLEAQDASRPEEGAR